MSFSDVIVFSADLSRFRPPITGIPGQSRGLFRKAKTLVLAYFAGGFRGRGDVLWFGRRFELSDLLRCIKKGRAPSVLREVSLRFQWWLKIAAGVAFWALNVEMACGLSGAGRSVWAGFQWAVRRLLAAS